MQIYAILPCKKFQFFQIDYWKISKKKSKTEAITDVLQAYH